MKYFSKRFSRNKKYFYEGYVVRYLSTEKENQKVEHSFEVLSSDNKNGEILKVRGKKDKYPVLI